MTACAIATVTRLVAEQQRELAAGAQRLWSDSVGAAAHDEDSLRMLQLIERVV